MRNGSFLIAAGAIFLFAAGSAVAGNSDPPAPFNISSAQDFAQQAAAVRSGLRPGGEYAGLSARNRYLVTRNLDFMTALMQARGGIDAMTGGERVRMYNAQSETNRLLATILVRLRALGDHRSDPTCRAPSAGRVPASELSPTPPYPGGGGVTSTKRLSGGNAGPFGIEPASVPSPPVALASVSPCRVG